VSELEWLRGLYLRGSNPAHVLRDDIKRIIDRIEELEQYKRDAWPMQEAVDRVCEANARLNLRIEGLEQTLRDKEIILEARLKRIEELERALRWYAGDGSTYDGIDIGQRARAVLEKKP
jgi:hypothetical protein